MNDLEKAKEISDIYMPDTGFNREDLYDAAMEMAQWKDEQFYKFLLWLDDHYVINRFTDGEPMTYAELIDNFKSNSYERDTTKTD